MTCYQLLLLGCHQPHSDELVRLLNRQIDALGLAAGALRVLGENETDTADVKLPMVGIFFGDPEAVGRSHPLVEALLEDSVQLITVVSDVDAVSEEVPAELLHVNALALSGAGGLTRIASLVLEAFRLLRRERRLFISYKRSESQLVANQLYDALDLHGFDVFIDVRSVPPGADFQAELWHRLADSDVVVLLDTPGFRESRWTTEELARANATNIQILHVLWPGQPRDEASSFSQFYELEAGHLQEQDTTARLSDTAVEDIALQVERLRARAIAARHRYLVDSFCDSVRDAGMAASVQPERWIKVSDQTGRRLAVVPTVGVPTSERLHRIFDDISGRDRNCEGVWLLYDDRGVLTSWLGHLSWLDSYLPVRTLTVSSCDTVLRSGAM